MKSLTGAALCFNCYCSLLLIIYSDSSFRYVVISAVAIFPCT